MIRLASVRHRQRARLSRRQFFLPQHILGIVDQARERQSLSVLAAHAPGARLLDAVLVMQADQER